MLPTGVTADLIAAAAFPPAAEAVAARRVPSAVFGVVTAAGDTAVRYAGHAQIEPHAIAMAPGCWFDLASLTKVIFTTTAILRLVGEERIRLDDPLTAAIPDLRQYDLAAPERGLTFRQCLTHQTHLPHVEPLYTYGQDPGTLRAFVLQRVWTPGPPVYSDINFILLGIAIERLTGKPLADQPLAHGLTFRPDPQQCAATERCTWRDRVLRGEVHDENAFAMGGAAGHAGLFGTVDGILAFAAAVLDGTLLPPPLMAEIKTRQSPTRTLGWEAAYDGWSGGSACLPSTIGHTGFTGTGLWIDFDRGVAWTLLTNCIHPSRHVDSGILGLRQRIGESVAAAVNGG